MKQMPKKYFLAGLKRLIGPQRWHYLSLVFLLTKRELKVKYRGTFLGYLWSMVNPLLFMTILSVVLGGFVKNIPNYSIYLLSGILFWNFATISISIGTNSIVQNAPLIKKVKIPYWIFPFVPLGTALTNFALALVPFFAISLIKGVSPPFKIIFLPILLFFFFLFLFGVSLALSSLNVFFRDISHVLEPVLQILFYATPIIYSRSVPGIHDKAANILKFNPFMYFIEFGRSLLFNSPDVITNLHYILIPLLSFSSLLIGAIVYKKSKKKIIFNL